MASTDYSQPHAHHASQSSSIGTATPPPNTKPYPVTSAPSKGTQPSPIQTHTIQPTATTQSPATPAKSTPFLLHEAQTSKQQPYCHIHVQKNRGATSPSATDSKNITAQPAVKWPSYSSTPNHDTLHAQPFPSHAPREGVRLRRRVSAWGCCRFNSRTPRGGATALSYMHLRLMASTYPFANLRA